MAKTKFKEYLKSKISNLFNKISNLFNNELPGKEGLTDFSEREILYLINESSEAKVSGKLLTILRQVVFFAPGAVILWWMSAGITEGIVSSSPIPWWAYLLFILSFFMTTFGLSDVRKHRNFLISVSSVLFGMSFGLVSGLFTDFLRQFINFITPIGLLSFAPLIWIMPLFVKLWLEKIEKETISD